MFCDGQCERKGKKCGLLTQLTMQNGSEVKTFDVCILKAILESLLRIENGNIRLQAAIESARNQKNIDDLEIKETIASGFLGMIYAINEDPKTEKILKKIGDKMIRSRLLLDEKSKQE